MGPTICVMQWFDSKHLFSINKPQQEIHSDRFKTTARQTDNIWLSSEIRCFGTEFLNRSDGQPRSIICKIASIEPIASVCQFKWVRIRRPRQKQTRIRCGNAGLFWIDAYYRRPSRPTNKIRSRYNRCANCIACDCGHHGRIDAEVGCWKRIRS